MDDSERRQRHIGEIAADRRRGASQLARRCLEILAEHARTCSARDAAELQRELADLADALRATRPGMAPVQNLLGAWRDALQTPADADPAATRARASALAQQLAARSRRAVDEAAAHAAGLVAEGATLITHSLSSTMVEVFRRLASRGVRAVVTESRPLLEGHTLARRLSAMGVATHYITDAQMGVFAGRADAAMVGADSLLGDGSVLNKAGTLLLALAAREHGVPFYVCCESFKQSDAMPGGIDLEEMDAAELRAAPLPGVTPRNVYFDLTPARLVSGWITEHGLRSRAPVRDPG